MSQSKHLTLEFVLEYLDTANKERFRPFQWPAFYFLYLFGIST